MTIQINTDKNTEWNQRHDDHFSELIREALNRFSDHITRVEVHLSDENGGKEGQNDIRCLIEVRVEGQQPIAASDNSDSIEQSVSSALTKLNASLKTKLERGHS
jgi:ribosome-associated translation inhibitor RaiA